MGNKAHGPLAAAVDAGAGAALVGSTALFAVAAAAAAAVAAADDDDEDVGGDTAVPVAEAAMVPQTLHPMIPRLRLPGFLSVPADQMRLPCAKLPMGRTRGGVLRPANQV